MADVFRISYPAPLIFKNGESPDIRRFSTKDRDVACENIRFSSLLAAGDVEKRMFSQANRDVFLVSNEILSVAGAIYAEFPLFWESYNDYFLAYKFARA